MRMIVGIALFCCASVQAAEPAPAAIEFFESKVRPLLIDNCVSCHGEKKQEAGLRLDTRDGFLKGSDKGPVVTPGNADTSKLIKAIQHSGDPKMPPKGKLPAEAIETLTAWVKLGAPYPASAAPDRPAADPRKHWAFQPVRKPAVPETVESKHPIDRFILAQSEAKGLAFSPIADKRTLIRRAYFDLINLPPTAEEIDAFETDASADAYEKLVDRLLASPHYGEAQARRWLDFARYADTKGYVFTEDRNYPYAYTYRDWAIRAFNEDMPYNRFIQLQIAADRLNPEDPRDLAAMGFLTLGRRFLNNVHDIIDDRLDVTCRTFMGLTVACARCHDHKYDPIPAADYYSLYGVFASSIEPKDLPLIGEVQRTPEVVAYEKELAKKEEELKAITQKLHAAHVEKLRKPEIIAAYLLAVRDLQGTPNERASGYLRERDLNSTALQRWRDYLRDANKEHSPVFAPLKALQAIPDAEFATKAPEVLAKLFAKDPTKKLNPLIIKMLEGQKPASFKDVAAIYGKLIASHWPPPAGPITYPQSEFTPILGAGGPADVPLADADKIFNRDDRNKFNEAKKKVDAFKAASPFAPPRAMVLADGPGYSPYVFLRGSPGNRGPAVNKQFLEILSGADRKPFSDGSGRLELANAIADAKNPLTSRVMVNRIWTTHFGLGLVRTPSDFGVRSDPPTHPALLDWLASEFVESGWSVKKMHRLIMLSSAYKQRSDVSAEMAKSDAENRLLGRQNRKRIDFEGLRDAMLLTAGDLDRTIGGKSVDIFKEPYSRRRTVYGFIDRQNLPGTFRIFDFASPDTHSPQRFVTTVPQQALFLMNSPFVMEQARKLVARPEVAATNDAEGKIKILFRTTYGRTPSDEEISLSRTFLEQTAEKTRWELFAQTLLLGNDFAFVD